MTKIKKLNWHPPPQKKKINILKYILVKNQFDEYIENI